MVRHLLILLTIALVVSGCASAPPPSCGPISWSGLSQVPNRPAQHKNHVADTSPEPDPNNEKEKVLGTLRPYSSAWWAMREQIDAEEQRHLTAKLMICRGCLPKTDSDNTGSIERPIPRN
jgi:hypothetical protein